MGVRYSEYARVEGDFYVEPRWAIPVMLDRVSLPGGLHDPCGLGTIVDAAMARGLPASGADIAHRANGRFPVRDFRSDPAVYPNIATNPPYKGNAAVEIITHALTHVVEGGRVAALVPTGFLHSQCRYPLLARPECELVIVLSTRPSLPPGELLLREGETCRHSGSTDFVWIVWQRGLTIEKAAIQWVRI
jgi:hypothetical protein